MSAIYQLFPQLPQGLVSTLAVLLALIQLAIAVVLALAVMRDAEKRRVQSHDVFLVPPPMWGIIVFMTGGYLGTLAYWIIHYSAVRQSDGRRT